MNKIFFSLILLLALSQNSYGQNTWTQKGNMGPTGRGGAVGFAIAGKGYVGTGFADGPQKDFWEYYPSSDTWTQKTDLPGPARYEATAFSIGDKGYLCDGNLNGTTVNDFWEYDPSTNQWTRKADFPGISRIRAVAFTIGSKAYFGTGNDGAYIFTNEFWEYDPITDKWTKKANFGGAPRKNAVGFSIGKKGYIGLGGSNYYAYFDFWEYDPSKDEWTQKSGFPGIGNSDPIGFSIGDKGYVGDGYSSDEGCTMEFWEYDPSTNAWIQKADCGGPCRWAAVGFSIGDKGYFGNGINTIVYPWSFNDFWEYTPDVLCSIPTGVTVSEITSSTANINWHEDPGVMGYTVRYKVDDSSRWTIAPALNNFKQLKNLLPSTTYAFEVKSICDAHPFNSSEPTEKQFFTTNSKRLNSNVADEIELYPNPVGNELTVNSIESDRDFSIRVYNLQGKLIILPINIGNLEAQINTSTLPDGLYTLQIINNETGSIELGKFVKQ